MVEKWIETYQALIADLPTGDVGGKLFHAGIIATPLGPMLAVCDETYLHLLEFCDLETLPVKLKKLQKRTGAAFQFRTNSPYKASVGDGTCTDNMYKRLETALNAYFAGERADFAIPCALYGTDFSCAVWRALQQIPVATSWSYAEQAAFIGRPTAHRAVAHANSRNQIAVIIPCHRVIGSNGRLTGYAGGLARKEWLLAHEKRYFG